MLHNVYISLCETCLSTTQETAGSGLNRSNMYNGLCSLWNITRERRIILAEFRRKSYCSHRQSVKVEEG